MFVVVASNLRPSRRLGRPSRDRYILNVTRAILPTYNLGFESFCPHAYNPLGRPVTCLSFLGCAVDDPTQEK